MMSGETVSFRNAVQEQPRGALLQSAASEVLATRTAYNETIVSHGPDSLEVRAARQKMLFAELVAKELISE